MHPGHEKVVCSNCGTLVRQCRCMDGNKPVHTVNGCRHCARQQAPPPVARRRTAVVTR